MAVSTAPATTNFITHGTDLSLIPNQGTVLVWGRANDMGGGDEGSIITGRRGDAGAGYRELWFDWTWGATGVLAWDIEKSGTDLLAESSAGAITEGVWHFAGAVWDVAGADSAQRLYVGNETTRIVEVGGYAGQTVGTGSVGTNSQPYKATSQGLWLSDTSIAWQMITDEVLTLGQIQAYQFATRKWPLAAADGYKLFCHYGMGYLGGTHPDLSGLGNNGTEGGTVTGADHPGGLASRLMFGQRLIYPEPSAAAAAHANRLVNTHRLTSNVGGVLV